MALSESDLECAVDIYGSMIRLYSPVDHERPFWVVFEFGHAKDICLDNRSTEMGLIAVTGATHEAEATLRLARKQFQIRRNVLSKRAGETKRSDEQIEPSDEAEIIKRAVAGQAGGVLSNVEYYRASRTRFQKVTEIPTALPTKPCTYMLRTTLKSRRQLG